VFRQLQGPDCSHCIRAQNNRRIVFGKQLRRLRLEKGVSQEKLAEMADWLQNCVGVLERGGQKPSAGGPCKLASALKVKAGELLVIKADCIALKP
jgi:transcriptional regulator with XRE-family HTH domain